MESQKQVKQTPANYIKEIRRKARPVFSTEQKIAIVVEGMRAETYVREICRKYGIAESLFYKWNNGVFEAGKQRLSGAETR